MRIQEIPLNYRFRFIHEPLGVSLKNEWRRFVGRDAELNELVSRILLSDGGAFLVTGYRGVGKTTFVNSVVQRLEERISQTLDLIGPTEIVSVYLNFARPMKPTELMFHILRGLRLQLSEKGLISRLDSRVRDQLELAFMRTSFSMGYKASDQTERSFEIGDLGLKIPYLGIGSKLKIGSKRTSGLNREYSYLAYDDKAAEYDLIQITRQLSKGYRRNHGFWRNLIRRNASSTDVRLKILFVFDELDKIEEAVTADGRSPIDEILGSLKNVFTTSGISFIFVAGRDTHERWVEDLGRGDSVYESIFTYARYLPALWTHVDGICDGLLAGDGMAGDGSLAAMGPYPSFKKFLAFKGRGIPRRIIRGFNDYVSWDGSKPCLRFSREHIRQFNFYANLHDLLVLNEEALFGNYRDETAARSDQEHLSVYYMVDWILRAGLADFTPDEVIAASRKLSRLIAPTEQVAPQMVSVLLQVLTRHEYIEEVPVSRVAQELGPGLSHPDPIKRYRIVRRRLAEMGRLNGLFDEEAKAVFSQQPPGIPTERYSVIRQIGRGGMSNVYEAIDKPSGRRVAIKQMLSELSRDESQRMRFKREAEILASLHHPNIVSVYDAAMDIDQMYIVMEFVQGIRLTDLIKQGRTKELSQFLHIARELLSTVGVLHDRGILWVDPKPGNIMITTEGRLILLDFGISRLMTNGSETENAVSVGTPAYMSPEAVRGEALDARSDLYSIGVILFEMLAGRLPFSDADGGQLAYKHLSAPPPRLSEFVDVPPQIENAVMKCLNKKSDQRFQSSSELLAALPEAENIAMVRTTTREAISAVAEDIVREESPTVFGFTRVLFPDASPKPPDPPVTPLPQPASPRPSNYLTFEDGSRSEYYPNPQRNTLGRSTNNDIVLDESAASRYHAVITMDNKEYVLEDLNTANGTHVNEERLQGPRHLRNGDKIRIGNTVLVFHGSE